MSRGRKPRADELDLWRKVARSTERLRPEAQVPMPQARPKPKPVSVPPETASIPEFRIGEKATGLSRGHDLTPSLSGQLAGQGVAMDAKSFRKLKRGRMQPEARIDLHGMTLAEAHPALSGFILQSHALGRRLVLVITGKGKLRDDPGPIPRRHGVLRHQVPQWLRMAPLHSAVLQVTEASRNHGGEGAYYVYLRRRR